jgi:hypothetical protein
MMDVGLNVAVIMVLVIGVFMVRNKPVSPQAGSPLPTAGHTH